MNPLDTINAGLSTKAGYCTGQKPGVTGTLVLDHFNGPGTTTGKIYDEKVVTPCPGSVANCAGEIVAGTVEGSLFLKPTFTGSSGAINYPGTLPTFQVTIPSGLAPVIQDFEKGTVTSSSMAFSIAGYTPPRANTQVCFTFKVASGAVLTPPSGSCYSQQDIDIWFQRDVSLATGSQFATTVTFPYSGDSSAIGSVEGWITNTALSKDSTHWCMDFKSGTVTKSACQ